MSMIEATPQRQKHYDGRKQDHGDAAEQRGRTRDRYEEEYDRRAINKKDEEYLRISLNDIEAAYEGAEPEEELDALLDNYLGAASDEDIEEYNDALNEEYDDEGKYDANVDGFLTEADLGLKSRHEITKKMARRVTLDPEFGYDDDDDSDLDSPIRIRYRL